MKRLFVYMLAAAALSGCTLIPAYRRPPSPIPNHWPADTTTRAPIPRERPPAVPAADIGWRAFFTDPRLRQLVTIALEHNHDLRIAVLNVEASQASFRLQRGALFPSISASGAGMVEKLPANGATQFGALGGGGTLRYFNAGIGFASYELDLFGRERSLTRAAFQQYLARRETRRSVEISLVSEVASDYFAVLADRARLKLTRDTLRSDTDSYHITKAMYDHETATLLALRQAESAVDSERASLAQYQRQLAEDTHALTLVLGEEIPKSLPPGEDLEHEGLHEQVPAGLPSELLARRPDILSAEHALEAANADIGVARAAFFPSIALTASGGSASSRLSGLFGGRSGTWSFAPTINLPLLTGGENRANLDLARIDKKIAVQNYERTIQTAFREVSDALSARTTYRHQLEAQKALVSADADAYRLAEMRFRAGAESYLPTLDSQRSLFAAEQQLVSLHEAELTNEVTLYGALGGGWQNGSL